MKQILKNALKDFGPINKVLIIPPDITRLNSKAGEITLLAYEILKDKVKCILPALGTHKPMTAEELDEMFPGIPHSLFKEHRFREDLVTLGEVPSEFVKEVSENTLDLSWPVEVNKELLNGYDLILSIGQVVPHEVIGMANYNKNIFVGVGGAQAINRSHYLGALFGMERIMGRADNPVRKVMNYASEHFAKDLPILYVQTVIDKDKNLKGVFTSRDSKAFKQAAELSFKENITLVEKPYNKVVVNLDPKKFKSLWLGNKAIYRTRMMIADGGELIVIAPGIERFGEDREIDSLIRKYGYIGSKKIRELVDKGSDLSSNLAAAAHLIHGSSEGRFKITYAPGKLSKEEIESVHYNYLDCNEALKIINDDSIYYIEDPAVGLWASKDKF